MPSRLNIDADRARIRQLVTGATTDKIAFYGATPVVQPAATAQSAVTTTAATTTTPAGYTTTAQANGIVTLLNQIRSDLITLGLIKGSA
jgi:UDP-N-acetyl-D-mannosaminuronic acid transferase (WecB/TagA/CpsF family)